MNNLTHYIIIRRDLPLGVLAAQITHAAGESGATYEWLHKTRFRGATAVVLEVANEKELLKADKKLAKHHILRVVVNEPDPPYNGETMAIGLIPVERERVEGVLREYQTLKTLYVAEAPLREESQLDGRGELDNFDPEC